MADATMYNFQALQEAVVHALDGQPNAINRAGRIVNRAITWITNQYRWRWREKPIAIGINQVNLPNGVLAANWNYNPYRNATVTSPSAWDAGGTTTGSPIYRDGANTIWVYSPNHGLQPALYVSINAAFQSASDTAVFTGAFTVLTTPDANTFTYANTGPQDLNALNKGGTSPYGYWVPGHYVLPSDFSAIRTLRCPTLSLMRVTPVTLDEIFRLRQLVITTTLEIFYCVSSLPQASLTTPPVPILYIFPTPTATVLNYLNGIYVRRICPLTNLTDVPDIPEQFLDLVYWTSRAMAVSSEQDRAGEDWRMVMSQLEQLKAEDAMDQEPEGYMKPLANETSGVFVNEFGLRLINVN